MHSNNGQVDTGHIQLINTAWKLIFAWVDKKQNALADKGWNPLNQNYLLYNNFRVTITRRENSAWYHISNNIIITKKKINGTTTSKSCKKIANTTSNNSSMTKTNTGSIASFSKHSSFSKVSSTTTTKSGDELKPFSGKPPWCLKAI